MGPTVSETRSPRSLSRKDGPCGAPWSSGLGAASCRPARSRRRGWHTTPRALATGTDEPTITWVGHSTLLIRVGGVNILTDPHWGDRASPLLFGGPRRFAPPGVPFDNLPRIDVVLISHDHYDHLDLQTVQRLAGTHEPLFLAPLGFKAWFSDHGINRAEDLDWWETREYGGIHFTAVPAQHFCQRTPWDHNRRLWASWAIRGGGRRLYFGGDTGYFRGFAEAGARFGPFDLAAIAISAYTPRDVMRPNHTNPEEAVRAAADLQSRVVLGIHWGTFDLADEPPDEPPRRFQAEAARRRLGLQRETCMKEPCSTKFV